MSNSNDPRLPELTLDEFHFPQWFRELLEVPTAQPSRVNTQEEPTAQTILGNQTEATLEPSQWFQDLLQFGPQSETSQAAQPALALPHEEATPQPSQWFKDLFQFGPKSETSQAAQPALPLPHEEATPQPSQWFQDLFQFEPQSGTSQAAQPELTLPNEEAAPEPSFQDLFELGTSDAPPNPVLDCEPSTTTASSRTNDWLDEFLQREQFHSIDACQVGHGDDDATGGVLPPNEEEQEQEGEEEEETLAPLPSIRSLTLNRHMRKYARRRERQGLDPLTVEEHSHRPSTRRMLQNLPVGPTYDEFRQLSRSARGHLREYRLITNPNSEPILSIEQLVARYRPNILGLMKEQIRLSGSVKIKFTVHATIRKTLHTETDIIDERRPVYFHCEYVILLPTSNLPDLVSRMFDYISDLIHVQGRTQGSGWLLERMDEVRSSVCTYVPMAGSAGNIPITLPENIASKRALANIEGGRNECFYYAVKTVLLRYLFESTGLGEIRHYRAKTIDDTYAKYQSRLPRLKRQLLQFPVKIQSIGEFEDQNSIPINILAYDSIPFGALDEVNDEREEGIDGQDNGQEPPAKRTRLCMEMGSETPHIYPFRISEKTFIDPRTNLIREPVNLLYTCLGPGVGHFWPILSMSRLMNFNDRNRRLYCYRCLNEFTTENSYAKHREYCRTGRNQAVKLPSIEKRKDVLKIRSFHAAQRSPYIAFADFESLLTTYNPDNEEHSPNPEKLHRHEAMSFYLLILDINGKEIVSHTYIGLDAVDVFLEKLLYEAQRLSDGLKNIEQPDVRDEDVARAHSLRLTASRCVHCKGPFPPNDTSARVIDHDHYDGSFRGIAHHGCNLHCKITDFVLPVFFHNLQNYDGHFITRTMMKYSRDIDVIPKSMEKFLTFRLDNVRFLDSLQFMNTSLDRWAQVLLKKGLDSFKHLRAASKVLGDEAKLKLVARKGVFPYEYMSSLDVFKQTELPPREAFYSSLSGETVSQEEYEHAQLVWKTFNCNTFKDYHDLYLESDVRILADCFQSLRTTLFRSSGLDPAHFFSISHFSWNACLYSNNLKMSLMTDPTMHEMVRENIRGGLTMVSRRHAVTNSPDLPNYNPQTPHSSIEYIDANNLYGWAMVQHLPTGNIEWLEAMQCPTINEIMALTPDSPIGYALLADLEYPAHLHEEHDDFPFLPRKEKISWDQVSPTIQQLYLDQNLTFPKQSTKLCATLQPKEKYLIHYRMLQLALSHGILLTRVHGAIKFTQTPLFAPYIERNTKLRAAATNDADRDCFKLMNNSIFGKTVENVDNRRNVYLVSDDNALLSLVASPAFSHVRSLTEDCSLVQMKKTAVVYNKPILVGFAILELAKLHMYSFHYGIIRPRFGNRCRLIFTDTDSFCYEVISEQGFWEELRDKITTHFDTSNQDPASPYYYADNDKVLGMFKNEAGRKRIVEIVALRPKLYCLKFNDGVEQRKAKGTTKTATRRELSLDLYRKVLYGELNQVRTNNVTIRSLNHQVYTMSSSKLSLSALDDKRYWLPDLISSHAYGYQDASGYL